MTIYKWISHWTVKQLIRTNPNSHIGWSGHYSKIIEEIGQISAVQWSGHSSIDVNLMARARNYCMHPKRVVFIWVFSAFVFFSAFQMILKNSSRNYSTSPGIFCLYWLFYVSFLCFSQQFVNGWFAIVSLCFNFCLI